MSQPRSPWINLNNQMKIPIPKSTLLCTTYIRYLSHYRSTSWSNRASFPPQSHQNQLDHDPFLEFQRVSQGFSCSFISEVQSRAHPYPLITATSARPRAGMSHGALSQSSANLLATEREICLKFIGAFNILFTPLMLECLTNYLDRWKTYLQHPMSVLDSLHFQTHAQANTPKTLIDLSATKLSIDVPKVNICCLQAGLAEDHVQLTDLRTPIDIVTMSLFALSCRQIQVETILSKRDQSTAAVVKIQSITGQFRRFENNFSTMEDVHLHAIQPDRCRIQFQIPADLRTHLPIGVERENLGFVMSELGLQRLCFKLINNAAKQQQQRISALPVHVQIDETPTTMKAASKTKSRKKQPTEVSLQQRLPR